MVDVYVAGYLTKETKGRFNKIEEMLTRYDCTVFNPARCEFDVASKAELDFAMLDRAKVLFVVTDRVSIGTFIEIGYMICRKLRGDDVKIVVCYFGDDKYKGIKTVKFIKRYCPMTVYVDFVTDDLGEALDKVLKLLGCR